MKATSGELPDGRGVDLRGEVGRHAGARLRRRRRSCACSRTTSATSPRRGRSWPACPTRSRRPPRCSTASWSPPTTTGRPSFGLLQQRMHVTAPVEVAARAAEVPVAYVVFDLLHLDGHDLCDLPLSDRRRLLDQVLEPGPRWRVSPLHDDGPALLEAAHATAGSRAWWPSGSTPATSPGKRTRTWLKVKVRLRQEMVVGGWLPGEGNRTGPHRGAARRLPRRARRRRPAPLRRPGGHGLQGRRADAGSAGCSTSSATDECPFDPPPPRAEILRGPALGAARAGRRARVRRVDPRRPPAPPELPRPARRQGRRRGDPRCLTTSIRLTAPAATPTWRRWSSVAVRAAARQVAACPTAEIDQACERGRRGLRRCSSVGTGDASVDRSRRRPQPARAAPARCGGSGRTSDRSSDG